MLCSMLWLNLWPNLWLNAFPQSLALSGSVYNPGLIQTAPLVLNT